MSHGSYMNRVLGSPFSHASIDQYSGLSPVLLSFEYLWDERRRRVRHHPNASQAIAQLRAALLDDCNNISQYLLGPLVFLLTNTLSASCVLDLISTFFILETIRLYALLTCKSRCRSRTSYSLLAIRDEKLTSRFRFLLSPSSTACSNIILLMF